MYQGLHIFLPDRGCILCPRVDKGVAWQTIFQDITGFKPESLQDQMNLESLVAFLLESKLIVVVEILL